MTAEERTWEVVRRAYDERIPTPRRAAPGKTVLVALAVAAVLVAAVASPPGRAVLNSLREAVGVQKAAPALLSLPAPGKLMVVSAARGGVWTVAADGSKRYLGNFDDAQWSPHGLYVVATERNELVALDPRGNMRWSIVRRGVVWPRWEGTHVDTRIAYFARSGLHVVAGDGTLDRMIDAHASRFPPAWDPARRHTLAYESGGAVVLRDVDSGVTLWRRPVQSPGSLVWSGDGKRLAVASRHGVTVLDGNGRVLRSGGQLGATIMGAAFRPGTHALALNLRTVVRSQVRLLRTDAGVGSRLLFAGAGEFGDIAWSPDGKWLLVDWRSANQWLFLQGSRVRAVANIARQFPRHDDAPPLLHLAGRWCCAS